MNDSTVVGASVPMHSNHRHSEKYVLQSDPVPVHNNDRHSEQYAPAANPEFTGIPKAPTAAADNNSAQIATTAFVKASASMVQNIVGGSRIVGTVYQNTTGRVMFVAASVYSSINSNFKGLTDAANPPTTMVCDATPATASVALLSFIVLPGNYYKVTSTAGVANVDAWTEWY